MSVAGIGYYAGHYNQAVVHRQFSVKEQGFHRAVAWQASQEMREVNQSQGVDCLTLYESMSKSRYYTETCNSTQLGTEEGAVTQVDEESEGEFLGLTMVPEEGQTTVYGMRAILPKESTPANPVVQVISNLGGEKKIYNVDISKVDPNHATQLEMFALMSYADEKGITDDGSFGSFHQLKVYGGNAAMVGYCDSLDGEEAFLHDAFDWPQLMQQMMELYFEGGVDKQSEDCRKLLEFLTNHEATARKDTIIGDGTRVIEKSVVSLPSGVSFYINEENGEVMCVDDTNNESGRQYLWTKFLTTEELDKCARLFEKSKGKSTWEYKYAAELINESFWDEYLSGERVL